MKQSNQREIWIDVLRAFACMCVLITHSPAIYDGQIPGRFIYAPTTYVGMSWGVDIFFMLSGALLLSKQQDLSTFYKKRFGRVLLPTIIWSIIYIFYESIFDGTFSWQGTLRKICMIPFETQTGLLWFMYVLIGIYLVAPILSAWLSNCSKKEVEIVLALWAATTFLPYLNLINEACSSIIKSGGPLYHFYGFIGYALLGYYIRQYCNWKISDWKFILLFFVSIVFPVVVFVTGVLPQSVLDGENNIAKVALSASAFIFFKNIQYKPSKIVDILSVFAKYSFGIYLSHIIFLKPLRYWLTQFHINYIIQIPLTALFVGLVSFGFVYLLSKFKYSKYIIG